MSTPPNYLLTVYQINVILKKVPEQQIIRGTAKKTGFFALT